MFQTETHWNRFLSTPHYWVSYHTIRRVLCSTLDAEKPFPRKWIVSPIEMHWCVSLRCLFSIVRSYLFQYLCDVSKSYWIVATDFLLLWICMIEVQKWGVIAKKYYLAWGFKDLPAPSAPKCTELSACDSRYHLFPSLRPNFRPTVFVCFLVLSFSSHNQKQRFEG